MLSKTVKSRWRQQQLCKLLPFVTVIPYIGELTELYIASGNPNPVEVRNYSNLIIDFPQRRTRLMSEKDKMDQGAPCIVDISETKEIDALYSLSEILQTGLNKRTITIIADLIQSGIEPESLVDGKTDRFQQAQPLYQPVIWNSTLQIRNLNSNGWQ